jgi:hypothetical protein
MMMFTGAGGERHRRTGGEKRVLMMHLLCYRLTPFIGRLGLDDERPWKLDLPQVWAVGVGLGLSRLFLRVSWTGLVTNEL